MLNPPPSNIFVLAKNIKNLGLSHDFTYLHRKRQFVAVSDIEPDLLPHNDMAVSFLTSLFDGGGGSLLNKRKADDLEAADVAADLESCFSGYHM